MGQTDALSYLILGRPIENATGEEGAMLAKATLALGLSGGNKLVRSLTEQFGLDEMRVESSEGNEQASLVMGRYLSPKLYVSYGVGLIEAFNTFTVRYQISDKWQLKGESGEYHGADLLYTIER
jgi:translocation and assembly module TamB